MNATIEKTADMKTDQRTELANKIMAEHAGVLTAMGQAYYRARTAGLLLLEARKGIRHGRFTAFVEDDCKLSARSANLYMQLAKHPELNSQQIAGLTLNDIVKKYLAKPRKKAVVTGKPSVKNVLTNLTKGVSTPAPSKPDDKPAGEPTADIQPATHWHVELEVEGQLPIPDMTPQEFRTKLESGKLWFEVRAGLNDKDKERCRLEQTQVRFIGCSAFNED